MESVLSIVGVSAGVLAFIISILGVINNRFQAVSNYYSIDRDMSFFEARKKVYNLKESEVSEDIELAYVISYFHFWGLMVKKRYLPFYVFKSASGISIMELYEHLIPTILARRNREEGRNQYYAEYFEWLYYKTKKYHDRRKPNETKEALQVVPPNDNHL
ncbi:MAG: hypothetical protein FWF91_01970 [Coriobacteriia bacterium]|nr:hypothetical protein [Coriobacteriia bacterium]